MSPCKKVSSSETVFDLFEISQNQPLIGNLISPAILIGTEYKEDDYVSPGFIPGLQYLAKSYLMRKVRGDGNCFYRSFLFAYLEYSETKKPGTPIFN